MTKAENAHKSSSAFRVDSAPVGSGADIRTIVVRLDPPSLDDNRSDLKRLEDRALNKYGIEIISAAPEALRALPKTARESGWSLTCELAAETDKGYKLISVSGAKA
ncbi:MAG: hypothetical protein WCX65_08240 [bacterium]